ncbi:MAG: Glu-tRNA(Gln) amidotransferase subunit GatE [Candidatus Micrarchaeaceae archaeon]
MVGKKVKGIANDSRYKDIGFMCGLEIHQRLATSRKLFCACGTNILDRSSKPDASITRYQRAVAGELGSIDKSAEFEEGRKRGFIYGIFDENTCLVDVDEEPPHHMNMNALKTAMSLAKSMNMHTIDELQPMRKGVIDGSDPSAFQRTVMVAHEGSININGIKIGIPSLFLEEESSGIVSNSESTVTYSTDRLGVPLIEIDTDPSIPDPKTAKDVALYIGTLLRLTGSVQRGIGSIRQDVNLSIKGGARVEIKGVQDLASIDGFLENEIKRQQGLIAIKERLVKAKASVGKAVNVTALFLDTNVNVIKYHIGNGAVFAFPLKGFKGLLGAEINPNRRLGTEISDYAKMAGVHGIIHSDEDLKKYGFSDKELAALRNALHITEDGSFVIVAGKPDDASKASSLAIWRAKFAMDGVPKETRAAHDTESCTSRFIRPLPSGSRMYPETDIKPIRITKDMIDAASGSAPNIERERAGLKSLVKNDVLVGQLMMSPKILLFRSVVEKSDADPEFVANILIQKLTELKRAGVAVDSIKDISIIGIFSMYANGRITKQAVEEMLSLAASGDDIEKLLEKNSLERIKGKKLAALVSKARKENGKASGEELRRIIMSTYRLRIDGSELNVLLSKNGKV